MSLLSESYNPHVRFGAAMALGIACAGTGLKVSMQLWLGAVAVGGAYLLVSVSPLAACADPEGGNPRPGKSQKYRVF